MELKEYYLIETIKIVDGVIFNIDYHNIRFNRSRKELFNILTEIDLLSLIKNYPKTGIIKCRILYNQKINSITYNKYIEKNIKTFYFVEDNNIDYSYKYENRCKINYLKKDLENKRESEILIVKNGFITDSSISNLAFYDNEKWITPKNFLLLGTTLNRLLENKKITKKDNISIKDIKNFTKIAMLNSMIGFKEFNIKNSNKFKIEV